MFFENIMFPDFNILVVVIVFLSLLVMGSKWEVHEGEVVYSKVRGRKKEVS